MKNFIVELEHEVNDELCDELIDIFNNSNFLRQGTTSYGTTPHTKRSTDLYINELIDYDEQENVQHVHDLIKEKFDNAVKKYKKIIPQFSNVVVNYEGLKMKMYYPHVGTFTMHSDISSISTANRALVVMLYLNDVDEGGETVLDIQGINIKPEKGKIVMFPPSWQFPHHAEIPLSDKKYTIQTFYCYSGDE